MAYKIVRMNFSTPVHIGRDRGGKSLSATAMTIHSDTLFSALCTEALKAGLLESWVKSAQAGDVAFSDALPTAQGEIYLPKPILYLPDESGANNMQDRKAVRKLEYVPLSRLDEYLQGLKSGGIDMSGMVPSFGLRSATTHAAIAGLPETQPYHVEIFRFFEGYGLYFVFRYKNTAVETLTGELLENVGRTGIGGKKSSGLGKFSCAMEPVPPELATILEDAAAPVQMLLSTALPKDDELESTLDGGYYQLVRRGGFVESETYADRPCKKRTTYALAAGSCLKTRFDGTLTDVRLDGAHPVWRNGKALFLGVRV